MQHSFVAYFPTLLASHSTLMCQEARAVGQSGFHVGFMVRWQDHLASQWPELGADSITLKEVLPIVWGIAIWSRLWGHAFVIVYCDNQGAVAAVNSAYSKVALIAHLLHCLFFIKARFNIELVALHIPGAINKLADAISHDELRVLFLQVLEARSHQHTLSKQVMALTLDQHLNWTSSP